MTERSYNDIVETTISFVKTKMVPVCPFGMCTIFLYHNEPRVDKSVRSYYVRVDFTYYFFVEDKDFQIIVKNIDSVSYNEFISFLHENRDTSTLFHDF